MRYPLIFRLVSVAVSHIILSVPFSGISVVNPSKREAVEKMNIYFTWMTGK